MPRLSEIILPGREPYTGDTEKDKQIQSAKLTFWCGVMTISVLTVAGFPILKKMGVISKKAMWAGLGVSGSVATVSSILTLKAWGGSNEIWWRKRVDSCIENFSDYETEVLPEDGSARLRGMAMVLRVQHRMSKLGDPRGLVWKITAPGEREHYLIGACTIQSNRAMINQEQVREALENTQIFISEFGVELLDGAILKKIQADTVSEGFRIDMTKEARKGGLEIRALETLDQRIGRLEARQQRVAEAVAEVIGNDFKQALNASMRMPVEQLVRPQRVARGWHLGDLSQVEKQYNKLNGAERQVEVTQRVNNWMASGVPGLDDQNLIEFLNEADGSCCVFVEALTCVGDRNVLQRLTEAGFTVERMGQEPEAAGS